jgi:hypothetical protein
VDKLRPIALTQEQAAYAYEALDTVAAEDNKTLATQISKLDSKMHECQRKLDRLTHGYLDQEIDADTFHRTKEELLLRKNEFKKEKEVIHRTKGSSWIEPAREVINTLEMLGKTLVQTDVPASLPELARLVRKIGTNPHISRKTVSFSLSAPYDFMAQWLEISRVELAHNPSLASNKKYQSSLWCEPVYHFRTGFSTPAGGRKP